jgi:hypothetical protein
MFYLKIKSISIYSNILLHKNYAVISIKYNIDGDNDGSEFIDKNMPQHEAREHLYERARDNISFVISQLKYQKKEINFDKIIVAGSLQERICNGQVTGRISNCT